MLAYAIDNPAPCTIILITGDRDFAYALSILKHRRYQVVLVTLPNAHASLVHQASICFDWAKDVINQLETWNSQHNNKRQEIETLDSNETRPSPYSLANRLLDASECDYAYPGKQASRDTANKSRNISSQMNNGGSQSSHLKRLQSDFVISGEDQTTTDGYSGSPTKSTFRQRDLPRFPVCRNSRGWSHILEIIHF